MAKDINFYENKIFTGKFALSAGDYTGKLIYESGKNFILKVYEASMPENLEIKSINGLI